jgi:hypothetical protein
MTAPVFELVRKPLLVTEEGEHEAGKRIALGLVCRLAVADVLQLVGLQSNELSEQAMRSHTVIAAGNAANDQLDTKVTSRKRAIGEKFDAFSHDRWPFDLADRLCKRGSHPWCARTAPGRGSPWAGRITG